MGRAHHRRFLVSPEVLRDAEVMFSPAQAHQLSAVLRLRAGDPVTVFDGSGREWTAQLTQVAARRATARLTGEAVRDAPVRLALTLAQVVPRGAAMDLIVAKATELGIARIVPLEAQRSVRRRASPGQTARWRRIAEEASEQCGRRTVPDVTAPCNLDALLERHPRGEPLLACDASAGALPLAGMCDVLAAAAAVTIVVGGEGGLTPEEIDRVRLHGGRVVSLGPRLLRAETAALAAVTVLQACAGDWLGPRYPVTAPAPLLAGFPEDRMPSILIVDDEPGLLASLVTGFETQGYRSHGALSAAEALTALQTTPFDVVLTDLVMPGMDGLALMDRIRTEYPDVVIILMTGGATVETAVRALKGGASDYVVKPFRLAEIFHAVERCREQHGLRRENLELSEVNRRLQELDRLKSNLVSAVSHEFRTPLTIMNGWLDLLLKGQFGPISAEQRESLSAVHKSAVRLGRLIANLLAFVDYERDGGKSAVSAVNIDTLLRKVAAELAPDCAERQVTLGLDLTPDLPTVEGDAEHLRLMLLNLMENAIKFNEPGGTVAVMARHDAGGVEVQVANSHGTIRPENVQRMLQPFTQGDMGLRRRAGGLGLGLAVAQAVVDAHRGELHLDVAEGQGTTVRVRLSHAGKAL